MEIVDFRQACEPLDVNIVSGDITIDEVGIINASDNRINPATEEKQDDIITQLQLIEDNTDGVEALLVDIEAHLNGQGKFGDTPDVTEVTASTASTALITSDATRKQVIIVNNSNQKMWISYVDPAALDKGFPLDKNDILIEDVYRGAMYGIWDTGVSGTAEITIVTE